MNIVLFSETEISKPLSLTDERAEHILKILHKTTGNTFTCGITGGKAGKATITKIDEKFLYFSFTPDSDGNPLKPLIMIIGFPRPIQLKRLFRDMAGLGVCEIHLSGTELSEKSYLKTNMLINGEADKALLEGTMQAKSTHIPKLIVHKSVADCINEIEKHNSNGTRILLDNIEPETSLSLKMDKVITSQNYLPVIAAIGSERGWTDRERELFKQNGYTLCSMGTRVLRTETAATVAASIILEKSGEL